MSARINTIVYDDHAKPFDPASLPHVYTYDTNGNMLTDTCIEQGVIARVKTYTYTEVGGKWYVATESAWVNLTA